MSEEATRVADSSSPEWVNVRQVLESALDTILPYAEQESVELELDMPPALPETYGDAAILHQLIVNVLAESIKLAATGRLKLIASPQARETVWRLEGLDACRVPTRDPEHITGFRISRTLLAACGGRLWLESCGVGVLAVCFALIRRERKVILVIDNNADALALYRRYLQSGEYVLEGATTGREARDIIAQRKPELILLDLLMPQEDGWSILRKLKSEPETMDVPVIVCSVLSQPQVALALGAAQVLEKPITQETLVKAVRAALTPDDSPV